MSILPRQFGLSSKGVPCLEIIKNDPKIEPDMMIPTKHLKDSTTWLELKKECYKLFFRSKKMYEKGRYVGLTISSLFLYFINLHHVL